MTIGSAGSRFVSSRQCNTTDGAVPDPDVPSVLGRDNGQVDSARSLSSPPFEAVFPAVLARWTEPLVEPDVAAGGTSAINFHFSLDSQRRESLG